MRENVYENWHWFNVTFHGFGTKLKEAVFYETKNADFNFNKISTF